MQLNQKDRLILSNQYRILARLDPENRDFYERAEEAVADGYELVYDWYADHIIEPSLGEHECREVLDILSMFEDLRYGYENLEDKSGIDETEIEFPGFDGNHESRQLGFAAFLIEKEKKFQSLKDSGDKLNSHAPLLANYRRMLPVWKSMKLKTPLGRADIQKIVAEMIHPSNR